VRWLNENSLGDILVAFIEIMGERVVFIEVFKVSGMIFSLSLGFELLIFGLVLLREHALHDEVAHSFIGGHIRGRL
jgi:hypothetical protein